MDVITRKILKRNNWPDGKIIGIAKEIAAKLADQGLEREAICRAARPGGNTGQVHSTHRPYGR
jgi:hypothetical protein